MFIHNDRNLLLNLFREVDEYSSLKKRITEGGLKNLSVDGRKAFISYLEKREFVNQAAINNDYELVKTVLEEGFDVNAITIDLHKHPGLISFFAAYGKRGMLAEALNFHSWVERSDLIKVIQAAEPLEFTKIDESKLPILIAIIQDNNDIAEAIRLKCDALIKNHPDALLNYISNLRFANVILTHVIPLAENKIIPLDLLERIILLPGVFKGILGDEDFKARLKRVGSLDVNAIYLNKLLDTKSLRQAAILLSFLDKVDWPHSVQKERVIEHIIALQKKEKTTLWHYIAPSNWSDSLIRFGFDPNWENEKRQNLLFTDLASECQKSWFKEDLFYEDVDGNNALEHHCLKKRSIQSLKVLTSLGLTLREKFPFATICLQLFPENSFLSALLATSLNNPSRGDISGYFLYLSKEEKSILRQKIKIDTPLPEPAKGYLLSELFGSSSSNDQRWRSAFNADNVPQIENLADDTFFNTIVAHWDGVVPPSAVNLIPGSPLASLVISTLQNCDKAPFEAKFFCKYLGGKDFILLHDFLFENPEWHRKIVEFYYIITELIFYSHGREESTNASFVSNIIAKMERLEHFKVELNSLPKWHKALIDSFSKVTHPIPQETLQVPGGPKLFLNRTAVVNNIDAYKFLLPNENYASFSQESSVTKAFNEISGRFKSTFHKPIGLYQIRKLPTAFKELHSLLGDGPYYVYHYKATHEIFTYVDELSFEDFQVARKKYLTDAATMVSLGIYPDIASLFHNKPNQRKYLLLVDLAKLLGISGTYAQGSGMLDKAFNSIRYSNVRSSGLTDLRDASHYYSTEYLAKDASEKIDKSRVQCQFFYQMHGLSNLLLIDMLLLTHHYRQMGRLNWQDDLFLNEFGEELAKAFASVMATYSKRSVEKALSFAKNCGIDWAMAAKQIAFWSDNSASGYLPWLERSTIPEGLYQKGIDPIVDGAGSVNFDPQKGYQSDGMQDLGAFNGPLGFTEFERAMYLLYIPLILAEPTPLM